MTELTRSTKAALEREFGKRRVSVRQEFYGEGWVRAVVRMDRPGTCSGDPAGGLCGECRFLREAVNKRAWGAVAGIEYRTHLAEGGGEPRPAIEIIIALQDA